MSEIENNNAPDEAAQWYEGQRQTALCNVDQHLSDLEARYSTLEQSHQDAEYREQQGHKDYDDYTPGASRVLVQALEDKQRYKEEAAQISNAYSVLQAERQRLATQTNPDFTSVLNATQNESAQMFLRSHRHLLENDPASLKRLLAADARATVVGLKPTSPNYYKALEAAMGWEAADRRTDDFFQSDKPSGRSEVKQTGEHTYTLSPEQKAFARDAQIPEAEYSKYAAANPFSAAATTIEVEPSSFDSRSHKPMEISLDDEAPKKATVDTSRYKPGPSSVNLSKTELELIDNMAVQTGQSVKEARLEFARQKHALMSGKAGHYQLYADKLASEWHH